MEGLVRVLANGVRGRGITVNAVAPGPVETELFPAGKPQEVIDSPAKASPFERLGQPADIARVTTFLAGAESGWIHGRVARVNGGFA